LDSNTRIDLAVCGQGELRWGGTNIMRSLFELYSNGNIKYVIAETLMDAVTFYEEKKEGEIVSSIKELGADIEIKGIYE